MSSLERERAAARIARLGGDSRGVRPRLRYPKSRRGCPALRSFARARAGSHDRTTAALALRNRLARPTRRLLRIQVSVPARPGLARSFNRLVAMASRATPGPRSCRTIANVPPCTRVMRFVSGTSWWSRSAIVRKAHRNTAPHAGPLEGPGPRPRAEVALRPTAGTHQPSPSSRCSRKHQRPWQPVTDRTCIRRSPP